MSDHFLQSPIVHIINISLMHEQYSNNTSVINQCHINAISAKAAARLVFKLGPKQHAIHSQFIRRLV